MNYKALYFINEATLSYLGSHDGNTNYTKQQIITNQVPEFLSNLASKMEEYIIYHPAGLEAWTKYELYTGFPATPNELLIIFVLSLSKPVCTFTYMGPVSYTNNTTKHKYIAHEWHVSPEECFSGYDISECLNLLLKHVPIWPSDHLVMCIVNYINHSAFMSIFFKPKTDLLPLWLNAINRCPADSYLVEFQYNKIGYFYTVKKLEVESGCVISTTPFK